MTARASPPASSLWHPDLLANALFNQRLTVLVGSRGPQREGMLRSGLMPRLRRHRPRDRDAVAIRFDGWGVLPLRALRDRIDAVFGTTWPDGPPPSLATHLRAIGRLHGTTVLLVLDAFERHLAERAKRPDIEEFDGELAACITDPTVPLHALMVVDDAGQQSLERYLPWIADDEVDFLRLPSEQHDVAAPWRDTDIETPNGRVDDAGRDAEWTLDLVLDDTPAAPEVMPPPAAHAAPAPAPNVASGVAEAPVFAAPADAERLGAHTEPIAAQPASGPTPAAMPRAPPLPPWLSEADVAAWRQTHPPPTRWPALLGLAVLMALLLAGAWMAARWILDAQRIEPRRAPVAAATRPQAASVPPSAAPAPAPSTTPTTAPVVAPPPAAANTLTYSLPADSDSAAPMFAELLKEVAAPAGLQLKPVAPGETPSLALWSADALMAARAAGAAPLQVVAPLFVEQIQVVVRNDARWDYVREIRGLRLNVGRADSARARTVRSLYQQLFGVPLPANATDERDVDQAVQQLLRRGGPIDVVVAVSESPLLAKLPDNERRQLRELAIDSADTRRLTALPAFSITRRTPSERPRLAVTQFLVATGASPRPHDDALRTLAAALCRAQPGLQARQSPLLRGLAQGQQPDVGWPYVLAKRPGQACPGTPQGSARRSGQP